MVYHWVHLSNGNTHFIRCQYKLYIPLKSPTMGQCSDPWCELQWLKDRQLPSSRQMTVEIGTLSGWLMIENPSGKGSHMGVNNDCWCSGSLRYQVISKRDVTYRGYMGPCRSWGTTHAIPMSKNDESYCGYISISLQNNSACKGLKSKADEMARVWWLLSGLSLLVYKCVVNIV